MRVIAPGHGGHGFGCQAEVAVPQFESRVLRDCCALDGKASAIEAEGEGVARAFATCPVAPSDAVESFAGGCLARLRAGLDEARQGHGTPIPPDSEAWQGADHQSGNSPKLAEAVAMLVDQGSRCGRAAPILPLPHQTWVLQPSPEAQPSLTSLIAGSSA